MPLLSFVLNPRITRGSSTKPIFPSVRRAGLSLSVLCLSAALGVACGGTALDPDGNENPAGAAGANSVGGSGGSAGNGGSSGGSAGSGGGDSCDVSSPAVGAPAQVLTVVIKNESSQNLYLAPENQDCSGVFSKFELVNAEGSAIDLEPLYCTPNCSDAMEFGGGGCPAICAMPTVTVLYPGQSTTVQQTMVSYTERTLPAECRAGGFDDAVVCQEAYPVPAEYQTVRVEASSDVKCDFGPCNEITCIEDDCFIYGASRGGRTQTVSEDIDPTTNSANVVFKDEAP